MSETKKLLQKTLSLILVLGFILPDPAHALAVKSAAQQIFAEEEPELVAACKTAGTAALTAEEFAEMDYLGVVKQLAEEGRSEEISWTSTAQKTLNPADQELAKHVLQVLRDRGHEKIAQLLEKGQIKLQVSNLTNEDFGIEDRDRQLLIGFPRKNIREDRLLYGFMVKPSRGRRTSILHLASSLYSRAKAGPYVLAELLVEEWRESHEKDSHAAAVKARRELGSLEPHHFGLSELDFLQISQAFYDCEGGGIEWLINRLEAHPDDPDNNFNLVSAHHLAVLPGGFSLLTHSLAEKAPDELIEKLSSDPRQHIAVPAKLARALRNGEKPGENTFYVSEEVFLGNILPKVIQNRDGKMTQASSISGTFDPQARFFMAIDDTRVGDLELYLNPIVTSPQLPRISARLPFHKSPYPVYATWLDLQAALDEAKKESPVFARMNGDEVINPSELKTLGEELFSVDELEAEIDEVLDEHFSGIKAELKEVLAGEAVTMIDLRVKFSILIHTFIARVKEGEPEEIEAKFEEFRRSLETGLNLADNKYTSITGGLDEFARDIESNEFNDGDYDQMEKKFFYILFQAFIKDASRQRLNNILAKVDFPSDKTGYLYDAIDNFEILGLLARLKQLDDNNEKEALGIQASLLEYYLDMKVHQALLAGVHQVVDSNHPYPYIRVVDKDRKIRLLKDLLPKVDNYDTPSRICANVIPFIGVGAYLLRQSGIIEALPTYVMREKNQDYLLYSTEQARRIALDNEPDSRLIFSFSVASEPVPTIGMLREYASRIEPGAGEAQHNLSSGRFLLYVSGSEDTAWYHQKDLTGLDDLEKLAAEQSRLTSSIGQSVDNFIKQSYAQRGLQNITLHEAENSLKVDIVGVITDIIDNEFKDAGLTEHSRNILLTEAERLVTNIKNADPLIKDGVYIVGIYHRLAKFGALVAEQCWVKKNILTDGKSIFSRVDYQITSIPVPVGPPPFTYPLYYGQVATRPEQPSSADKLSEVINLPSLYVDSWDIAITADEHSAPSTTAFSYDFMGRFLYGQADLSFDMESVDIFYTNYQTPRIAHLLPNFGMNYSGPGWFGTFEHPDVAALQESIGTDKLEQVLERGDSLTSDLGNDTVTKVIDALAEVNEFITENRDEKGRHIHNVCTARTTAIALGGLGFEDMPRAEEILAIINSQLDVPIKSALFKLRSGIDALAVVDAESLFDRIESTMPDYVRNLPNYQEVIDFLRKDCDEKITEKGAYTYEDYFLACARIREGRIKPVEEELEKLEEFMNSLGAEAAVNFSGALTEILIEYREDADVIKFYNNYQALRQDYDSGSGSGQGPRKERRKTGKASLETQKKLAIERALGQIKACNIFIVYHAEKNAFVVEHVEDAVNREPVQGAVELVNEFCQAVQKLGAEVFPRTLRAAQSLEELAREGKAANYQGLRSFVRFEILQAKDKEMLELTAGFLRQEFPDLDEPTSRRLVRELYAPARLEQVEWYIMHCLAEIERLRERIDLADFDSLPEDEKALFKLLSLRVFRAGQIYLRTLTDREMYFAMTHPEHDKFSAGITANATRPFPEVQIVDRTGKPKDVMEFIGPRRDTALTRFRSMVGTGMLGYLVPEADGKTAYIRPHKAHNGQQAIMDTTPLTSAGRTFNADDNLIILAHNQSTNCPNLDILRSFVSNFEKIARDFRDRELTMPHCSLAVTYPVSGENSYYTYLFNLADGLSWDDITKQLNACETKLIVNFGAFRVNNIWLRMGMEPKALDEVMAIYLEKLQGIVREIFAEDDDAEEQVADFTQTFNALTADWRKTLNDPEIEQEGVTFMHLIDINQQIKKIASGLISNMLVDVEFIKPGLLTRHEVRFRDEFGEFNGMPYLPIAVTGSEQETEFIKNWQAAGIKARPANLKGLARTLGFIPWRFVAPITPLVAAAAEQGVLPEVADDLKKDTGASRLWKIIKLYARHQGNLGIDKDDPELMISIIAAKVLLTGKARYKVLMGLAEKGKEKAEQYPNVIDLTNIDEVRTALDYLWQGDIFPDEREKEEFRANVFQQLKNYYKHDFSDYEEIREFALIDQEGVVTCLSQALEYIPAVALLWHQNGDINILERDELLRKIISRRNADNGEGSNDNGGRKDKKNRKRTPRKTKDTATLSKELLADTRGWLETAVGQAQAVLWQELTNSVCRLRTDKIDESERSEQGANQIANLLCHLTGEYVLVNIGLKLPDNSLIARRDDALAEETREEREEQKAQSREKLGNIAGTLANAKSENAVAAAEQSAAKHVNVLGDEDDAVVAFKGAVALRRRFLAIASVHGQFVQVTEAKLGEADTADRVTAIREELAGLGAEALKVSQPGDDVTVVEEIAALAEAEEAFEQAETRQLAAIAEAGRQKAAQARERAHKAIDYLGVCWDAEYIGKAGAANLRHTAEVALETAADDDLRRSWEQRKDEKLAQVERIVAMVTEEADTKLTECTAMLNKADEFYVTNINQIIIHAMWYYTLASPGQKKSFADKARSLKKNLENRITYIRQAMNAVEREAERQKDPAGIFLSDSERQGIKLASQYKITAENVSVWRGKTAKGEIKTVESALHERKEADGSVVLAEAGRKVQQAQVGYDNWDDIGRLFMVQEVPAALPSPTLLMCAYLRARPDQRRGFEEVLMARVEQFAVLERENRKAAGELTEIVASISQLKREVLQISRDDENRREVLTTIGRNWPQIIALAERAEPLAARLTNNADLITSYNNALMDKQFIVFTAAYIGTSYLPVLRTVSAIETLDRQIGPCLAYGVENPFAEPGDLMRAIESDEALGFSFPVFNDQIVNELIANIAERKSKIAQAEGKLSTAMTEIANSESPALADSEAFARFSTRLSRETDEFGLVAPEHETAWRTNERCVRSALSMAQLETNEAVERVVAGLSEELADDSSVLPAVRQLVTAKAEEARAFVRAREFERQDKERLVVLSGRLSQYVYSQADPGQVDLLVATVSNGELKFPDFIPAEEARNLKDGIGRLGQDNRATLARNLQVNANWHKAALAEGHVSLQTAPAPDPQSDSWTYNQLVAAGAGNYAATLLSEQIAVEEAAVADPESDHEGPLVFLDTVLIELAREAGWLEEELSNEFIRLIGQVCVISDADKLKREDYVSTEALFGVILGVVTEGDGTITMDMVNSVLATTASVAVIIDGISVNDTFMQLLATEGYVNRSREAMNQRAEAIEEEIGNMERMIARAERELGELKGKIRPLQRRQSGDGLNSDGEKVLRKYLTQQQGLIEDIAQRQTAIVPLKNINFLLAEFLAKEVISRLYVLGYNITAISTSDDLINPAPSQEKDNPFWFTSAGDGSLVLNINHNYQFGVNTIDQLREAVAQAASNLAKSQAVVYQPTQIEVDFAP